MMRKSVQLTPPPRVNFELKMELIKKRRLLWSDGESNVEFYSLNTTKLGDDSLEEDSVSECESDDSDTFNPMKNINWRNNSYQGSTKTFFQNESPDTSDTEEISFASKTSEDFPQNDNYDVNIQVTLPVEPVISNPVEEENIEIEMENLHSDHSNNVSNEGEDISNEGEDIYLDSDEDEINVDAVCMFEGGHKRNRRDLNQVGNSLAVTNAPRRGGLGEEPIAVADTCYTPGALKYKFLIDTVIEDVSSFTNYETEHVYFTAEHLQSERPVTLIRGEAIWTEEFPGCFVSRAKINDTVTGLIKISGKTIRPFSRVESKQPMHIVIISGEIILKANLICRTENHKEYALERTVFTSGGIIILHGGSWFSLENHTENTTELSYSFFDVS